MDQTASAASLLERPYIPAALHAHSAGVSWAAVIGGAVVTAAMSLILLALGAGLGLSAVSPWSGVGASASAMGTAVILWLILMQVMSGSLGGYLAGRLRSRWVTVHDDEVYFRDTAHGFLAWGLALVITAAFLATAATAMVGAVATSPAAAHGAAGGQQLDPDAYYVDMLFRSPTASPGAATPEVRGEAGRIFSRAMVLRDVPVGDRAWLSQLIVTRTGLSESDAEKRLSDVLAMATQAADATRKAVSHSLLWIFLALLIGAFCASLSATIGGRQRDHVVTI